MTEEQILAQRAALYARSDEKRVHIGTRCLLVELRGRRWLFPEAEIRLLMPRPNLTALPSSVRWRQWPCAGLTCHALTPVPVLCWSALVTGRDLAPGTPQALLLLRRAPVALRVPEPVLMVDEDLSEVRPEDHAWSAGKSPSEASVALLDSLAGSAS